MLYGCGEEREDRCCGVRGGTDAVDEDHEVVEPFASSGRCGVRVCGGAVSFGPGLCGVGHEAEIVHKVRCTEGDAFVCFLSTVSE